MLFIFNLIKSLRFVFLEGVVMYNMNNILDLFTKPSKTVRNFNNYVQANLILAKDKKSVDTLGVNIFER